MDELQQLLLENQILKDLIIDHQDAPKTWNVLFDELVAIRNAIQPLEGESIVNAIARIQDERREALDELRLLSSLAFE
jgi:hypothetical protein